MTDNGDSPLRVHLVHQSFGDYVSALVDGFADRDDVDLTVSTITSGAATLSGLRSAAADHRSRTVSRFRDPRSPFEAFRVVREVLRQPADLIHWQAAGNPWIDAWFSVLMGRTPTVVTVHDMVPHPGDGNVLPGTFAALGRVARKADLVTVHAPHVRDQAIEAGVDPASVAVVAHGELATRYLPPEQLPLPVASEPSVLFFGRAQGYKGLDLLYDAMVRMNRSSVVARLVVAGSGPSIDRLVPAGEEPPTWCKIRSGHIPADDVPGLFEEASVVALPYREASQSGVAALAAGFGKPVVATAVPGLVDIVEDGVTGVLVEPNDPDRLAAAIAELVVDPGALDRLGTGARSAAETRLSWSVITGELRDLYLGVLEERAGN
ncbi:MAG: glycosyltransferase [Actinomycetota bacterium]